MFMFCISENFYQRLLFLVLLTASTASALANELPQSTHPVWSNDGSQIAFINNQTGVENDNPVNFEIFTMNSDGSNLKQHTFNKTFDAEISWSANDDKLAIKSYLDGNDEIVVLNLFSGSQTNISNHSARDDSPFWHPDKDILFYQSDRDNLTGELYAYDLKTRVTTRLTHNEIQEYSAVWSPSLEHIAFVANVDGDDDLYVMREDGTQIRQLTNNPLNDWYPQWSPDGKQLMFTYGDWDKDTWNLRILDIASGKQRTLLKGVDSGNASWHPDGERIVFASVRSGSGQIYINEIATGTNVKITPGQFAKDKLTQGQSMRGAIKSIAGRDYYHELCF